MFSRFFSKNIRDISLTGENERFDRLFAHGFVLKEVYIGSLFCVKFTDILNKLITFLQAKTPASNKRRRGANNNQDRTVEQVFIYYFTIYV